MSTDGAGTRSRLLLSRLSFRHLMRRALEVRFWVIQLLVLGVSAVHFVVEYTEEHGELRGFWHGLQAAPVEAYLVPVVLAAIWYGLEGGVLTAILAASLSVPNLILFHRDEFSWLGEGLATLLVLTVGVVVATIVERLRVSREAVESANQRLRILNDVTTALNRSHGPSTDLVKTTLEHLVRSDGIRAVAFMPETPNAGLETAHAGEEPAATRLLSAAPGAEAPAGLDPAQYASAQVESRRSAFGWLLVEAPDASHEAPLAVQVARELGVALESARARDQERSALQQYAWAVTMGQERERKRLARDLHDGPAQSLVYVSRGLTRLSGSGGKGHETLAAELRDETQRALNAIRRTTYDLRPALLDDLGLVPAVQSLVEHQNRRDGPEVEFSAIGEPSRLTPELELASFRIAQEALSNVHRHSEARRAEVLLEFMPGRLRLVVSDDGIGFDPAVNGRDWFGLMGMRERAELVGGTVRVESGPGEGSVVVFDAATAAPNR